jgi:hypothetical protein
VIRPNMKRQGSWEWRNEPADEKPSAAIGFDVQTGIDSGVIRLRYTVTMLRVGELGRAVELMHFPISLTTSSLPSKGLRWWFICPAQREDKEEPCGRRVGKLYLPSGGRVFGCRHCCDLTYESCRESRRGLALWNSVSADVGIPGTVIKRVWDQELRDERRLTEWYRQRAVFRDARNDTDIPSTSMDSVK